MVGSGAAKALNPLCVCALPVHGAIPGFSSQSPDPSSHWNPDPASLQSDTATRVDWDPETHTATAGTRIVDRGWGCIRADHIHRLRQLHSNARQHTRDPSTSLSSPISMPKPRGTAPYVIHLTLANLISVFAIRLNTRPNLVLAK